MRDSFQEIAGMVPMNSSFGFEDKEPIFHISPTAFRQFALAVNVILTPIICTAGLIGNSIGLIVLSKDPNKKSMTIYTYLISLMAVDVAYLALGFGVAVLDAIEYHDWYLGNLIIRNGWRYIAYVHTVLKHMFSSLLLFMSIERLMSLLRPYTVKDSFVSKYPKRIITICFIVFSLYLIPWAAAFETTSFEDSKNRTVYMNYIDEGYQEFFEYYSYFETAMLHCMCPLTVLLLNISIAVAYSKFLRQRSSNLKSAQSIEGQNKITAVVLCVAGLYVILSLPSLLIQTLIFFDKDYTFYGRFKLQFFVLVFLGDLLVRINAANDFYMYILISSRYRGMLNTNFCKCFKERGHPAIESKYKDDSDTHPTSSSSLQNV